MADTKAVEVQSLIRTIQVPAISKAILQSICAVNGIPKTGNKTDLQRRIIQRKSLLFGFMFLKTRGNLATLSSSPRFFISPFPTLEPHNHTI
jgi:hypothetical protein